MFRHHPCAASRYHLPANSEPTYNLHFLSTTDLFALSCTTRPKSQICLAGNSTYIRVIRPGTSVRLPERLVYGIGIADLIETASPLKPSLLIAICLICSLSVADWTQAIAQSTNPGASRYATQHDQYVTVFQDSLARLIADCQAKNLQNAGAELLPWQVPVDVASLSDRTLPQSLQPEIPLSLPQAERLWRLEFQSLRQDLAKNLYLLSRRVLNAGNPHAAWRLIHEVLWYDSDYGRARTLLGYEQFGSQWVTPSRQKSNVSVSSGMNASAGYQPPMLSVTKTAIDSSQSLAHRSTGRESASSVGECMANRNRQLSSENECRPRRGCRSGKEV